MRCCDPGAQPGKWRLNLGTCAVGTHARSRTPHQQGPGQGNTGGKEEKLADLEGNAGGKEKEQDQKTVRKML